MTSFTGLGHEEALGRARALVPALRERAARDESLRQMSKETLNDLHHAVPCRLTAPPQLECVLVSHKKAQREHEDTE